jgi:hypothetical protein
MPDWTIETDTAAENWAILLPPGENPGGTPTRSETQGVQGRMTMRIVEGARLRQTETASKCTPQS